jgi:hypothetical protein
MASTSKKRERRTQIPVPTHEQNRRDKSFDKKKKENTTKTQPIWGSICAASNEKKDYKMLTLWLVNQHAVTSKRFLSVPVKTVIGGSSIFIVVSIRVNWVYHLLSPKTR